ncbi:hypothetical protein [Nocardioides sp.]|uniref:hypothetical protein n=1 Tax=Nocardioides sp. TaxID=35761 RepID=UPI002CD085BF|nr:hypothetical protein [Nocardioides sp.]HXH76973.1 hypothetical protein [Nocardioides sp.]
MRKFIWPVVLVLVTALLIAGGILLSRQQPQDGLEAGTLISETASGALVGRSTEVRVPWGSLQVTVTEPLDETPDGEKVGPGASLVGVQVSLRGPEDLLVTDRVPNGYLLDPTFTLVADDEEYLLEGLAGWINDEEITPVSRRQYVALKGVPEKLSLRVGYEGVEQVVDGLTGILARGKALPLYELGFPGGAQPCAEPLWSTGAGDVGENVTTCLITSSAMRPYVAGLGWAPEGSRWMLVTVLPGTPAEFEGPKGTYTVVDATTTYLLDLQAPVKTFDYNDALPPGVVPAENDPQVAVFEVAEDRPTGQFEVRTELVGETEVTFGKGKKERTKTKTFEALVAQGAFL